MVTFPSIEIVSLRDLYFCWWCFFSLWHVTPHCSCSRRRGAAAAPAEGRTQGQQSSPRCPMAQCCCCEMPVQPLTPAVPTKSSEHHRVGRTALLKMAAHRAHCVPGLQTPAEVSNFWRHGIFAGSPEPEKAEKKKKKGKKRKNKVLEIFSRCCLWHDL